MDPILLLVLCGGCALLALALGAAALLRRRRLWLRRIRRRPARSAPRHPVILLHGLLGFDELGVGPARSHYFRGLSERMERLGAEVHRPRVPSVAGVARRAEQLARRIDRLPGKRVNLVAHSMGGLDARYAIARLGLAPRVASLVTIGTPHRGTPLADLGAALGIWSRASRALAAAGLDVSAFLDLTTARTSVFNEQVPDHPDVWYGCVVAWAAGPSLHPLLRASHRYLWRRAGANDGLVPLASQRWGRVVAEIEADHWAQIGWSRRFDAAALFEELLRELRGLGF